MKNASAARREGRERRKTLAAREVDFPLESSVGYQIRATHRALQRLLQLKIESYEVTLGMWYFLRALWHEDGLTQRELSNRIGTMEPTTLSAIQIMERKGLVRRVQNKTDRRKWHVHLTPKARKLKKQLIPLARNVVKIAVEGLPAPDVEQLLTSLAAIQKNLHTTIERFENDAQSADD
jgi:MarR family transcriptional regulator, organic hydroperoxide resistance regulator